MNEEYAWKDMGKPSVLNLKPNYNITFHNNHDTGGFGKEVGKLDFNGPALVFTGDAEESAKVFIDWVARSFAGRLEDERKAEREACAKVCEAEFDKNGGVLETIEFIDAIRARSSAKG